MKKHIHTSIFLMAFAALFITACKNADNKNPYDPDVVAAENRKADQEIIDFLESNKSKIEQRQEEINAAYHSLNGEIPKHEPYKDVRQVKEAGLRQSLAYSNKNGNGPVKKDYLPFKKDEFLQISNTDTSELKPGAWNMANLTFQLHNSNTENGRMYKGNTGAGLLNHLAAYKDSTKPIPYDDKLPLATLKDVFNHYMNFRYLVIVLDVLKMEPLIDRERKAHYGGAAGAKVIVYDMAEKKAKDIFYVTTVSEEATSANPSAEVIGGNIRNIRLSLIGGETAVNH